MSDSVPPLEQAIGEVARDALDSFVASETMQLDPMLTAGLTSDPVLAAALRSSHVLVERHPRFADAVRALEADPELSGLASVEGQLDPMLIHSGGGHRHSPTTLLSSVVQTAFTQMYFRDLPRERGTLVSLVLANMQQLRRGVSGSPMITYTAIGFSGVRLPAGRVLHTPWGEMLNTVERDVSPFTVGTKGTRTSAFLFVENRDVLIVDRNPQPPTHRGASEVRSRHERATLLLPLAFALSSGAITRAVPLVTVYVSLSPFSTSMGYPWPSRVASFGGVPLINQERAGDVERWSAILDAAHTSKLDVAARRVVSALAERWDASDQLIDAVTAWENICGTHEETTFRVTAALTKLIEPERTKRLETRSAMAKIYGMRSRVVHGAAVNLSALVESANEAINIALRCLIALYDAHPELLDMESTRRADELLLLSD